MTKYDNVMLEAAELFAKQSYCKRRQVGAVLAKDGRIIATGYNGTISGTPNECEDEDGNTSDFTVHAEQNVITYCAKHGIPTQDSTLYITTSPCKQCAKLIAQSGITRVIYMQEYRDTQGVEFLKQCHITIEKKDSNS